tara:strand:- start:498 stop:851 length:354 start_codon:yes stop_codon:yes gene_type:complete
MWEVIDEDKKECPDDKNFDHKGYGWYAKKGESDGKWVRGDDCKYYVFGSQGYQDYTKSQREKNKNKPQPDSSKQGFFSKVKSGIKQGREFAKKDKEEKKKKIKKGIKNWFNNLSFLN